MFTLYSEEKGLCENSEGIISDLFIYYTDFIYS